MEFIKGLLGFQSGPNHPPVVDPVDKLHVPDWAAKRPSTNPVVYFDLAIGDAKIGRVEMTLAKVSKRLMIYWAVHSKLPIISF